MPYLWNTELFCFSKKKSLFSYCSKVEWWLITSGGGWRSDPKSDDSDDDNITPVEVAGGVMPKRTPWLVLGPDHDDENDWKWRWITMMKIIMNGDYDDMMFNWYFFYLTRQGRRQKTLFLDNWRRSPGIVWLPACFLHWLKWFCFFCFDHNWKVWFWTLWRRGWDSPVQVRSSHGETVPSGSVSEIRLIYVSKMCYNQIACI